MGQHEVTRTIPRDFIVSYINLCNFFKMGKMIDEEILGVLPLKTKNQVRVSLQNNIHSEVIYQEPSTKTFAFRIMRIIIK